MWYIYLLRLKDNSLYTGITKDIENRIETHRSGKGSKYVRSRLPCKLVYKEKVKNKSLALKRELEIKSWSKSKKEKLVFDYKKKNTQKN